MICADKQRVHEKLLEAGLALFEQKGFNATGLQEIADAAGIVKGSFYNYFASKDAFAVEVIRFYTARHVARWEQALAASAAEPPHRALRSLFLQLARRYAAAQPKKGCLIGNLAAEISEASPECRRAMQGATAQFKAVLARCLAEGQKAGKVRADLPAQRQAELFWDAWQGCLLRMKIENSTKPLKDTLETLFASLLTPAPGRIAPQ